MTLADKDIVWNDATVRACRLGTVKDHGEETDIARLVRLSEASTDDVALDMITGLGHVARALVRKVARVDAFDPDAEMLSKAEAYTHEEGLINISFIESEPGSLPCESDSYDIVAARMALRHLGNGAELIKEAHRVLKPTGRFLLAESLAPQHSELEGFQLNLMKLRDRSHVKSYSLAELEIMLECENFNIDMIEIYPKKHDFDSWARKLGADNDSVRMIAKMLMSASARAKHHFRVIEKGVKLVSFITWMILIRARPADS